MHVHVITLLYYGRRGGKLMGIVLPLASPFTVTELSITAVEAGSVVMAQFLNRKLLHLIISSMLGAALYEENFKQSSNSAPSL